jgi:hypothetical protein
MVIGRLAAPQCRFYTGNKTWFKKLAAWLKVKPVPLAQRYG